MSDAEERDYLWDGSGEADAELRGIERQLRPLGHHGRPPRRRRGAIAAALLALVTFAAVFVALSPRRVPARIAGLFQSNFPGEIGVRGGTRVEFRVLSKWARGMDALRGGRANSFAVHVLRNYRGGGSLAGVPGAARSGASVSQALTDKVAAGLRKRGANVVFTRPGEIVVDLVGVKPAQVKAWSRGIAARGVLEITRVASDTPRMQKIAHFVAGDAEASDAGVRVERDMWMGGHHHHVDPYLRASDCHTLRQYLASLVDRRPDLTPRSGFEIALEAKGGNEPACRSYYVAARAPISRRDIAGAEPAPGHGSGEWGVLLRLTAAGQRRFTALTTQAVGEKLAIMLDGRVMSAPVVQSPITGDRVWITTGHTSREEAIGLAAALRNGPLPAPVTVAALSAVTPSISGAELACARALFALPFALLVLVLVLAIARLTPATDPEVFPLLPAERRRSRFARRALVTAGAIAAAAFCVGLPLPFVDRAALPAAGAGWAATPFALGLMPILVAFALVELVALVVPQWRRLRLAGPQRRVRLTVAAWVVGIVVAALQGMFLCQWMTAASRGAQPVLSGLVPQGLAIATLVAGTALLGLLAVAVERFGIGNGFAVVLLGGIARGAWIDGWAFVAARPSATVVAGVVMASVGVIALTAVVLRVRARGKSPLASVRLPTCGVVPAAWSAALLGIVAPTFIGTDLSLDRTVPLSAGSFGNWILLGVAVALAVMASWLFSRPRRLTATARIRGAAAPFWKPFVWATAVSTAYVAALVGVSIACTPVHLGVVTVSLAAAIVVDLIDDARAQHRNDDLVPVWPLQRVQLADMAMHALVDRGIDVHARGRNLRALLHIFGAFAPIMLMVPRERADEAREILSSLLAPPEPPKLPAADGRRSSPRPTSRGGLDPQPRS